MNIKSTTFFLTCLLLLSAFAMVAVACPPPYCGPCYTWNEVTEECEWDCESKECCTDSDCPDAVHYSCIDCECICDYDPYYTAHTVIDPVSITSPTDGESFCVGTEDVTATCTTSTDSDIHHHCVNNVWTEEPVDDPVTHSWSGAGTFDPTTGTSVTWTAPTTAGEYTITVTASDSPLCNESDPDDSITVYVVDVNTVVWEKYQASNPDLGTCPNNDGKMMYPGKISYGDTDSKRNKVAVKATITPVVANVTVYFSWWDIDDPSSSTSPIDDNDSGGPTGGDNKGSGESLSATSATTNASGEATVTFTVSMQPGDNFKIAASCCQAKLNEMTQAKADGQESLPDTVVLSDMLTTWRKLWVERDYMAQVPSTGGEMNRVLGTAGSCTYNETTGETTVDLGRLLPYWFDDIDQFEGGLLKFTDSGNTYPVISSTANLLFNDEVVVTGNCSTESDKSYILFDDDNQDLFDSPYYCSFDAYFDAFKDAYIKPVYLPDSYNDQVNFNLNLTDLEVSIGVDYDNEQEVWSSSYFWACLIVSCYQPGTSTDMDPDGDGPGDPEEDNEITMGAVPEDNDNAIAIFVETIQDYVPILETRAIAHEVGHTGGGEHSDGGLMSDGLGSGNFTDTTLNTFRSHATWLTTN